MDLRSFIKKRPYLIWHTKNFDKLSDEAVVEAVLNWGDFDDVKKLLSILGVQKTAQIFYKQLQQERINYDPKVRNYFELFFKKYVS